MNILGLFDGISCGQVALRNLGITDLNYYASEIDKYAIQITQRNFPETIQLGNIYDIDYDKLPKIDLILGGSPCTHWSIAKRDRETTSSGIGFDLFMQYVKAVRTLQPKYFLYENNYSIHKDIKDAISKELQVEPIVINSALVSAQQRKRCYWTNIPNVTQPEDKNIMLSDILDNAVTYQDKSYCVTSTYDGAILLNTLERKQRSMVFTPVRIGHYGIGGQAQRIYSVHGKSVKITANGGGQGAKTGLYKIDLPDGDYFVRKLTPVECERLQNLADGYTNGISKSQRYKCIGNGWTVGVIEHILKNLSI